MDRSREGRRGVTLAASNGLSRRRQRSNSLRDSPDEDGPLELQETARLRDRKKDRDRDRDRERDRTSRSSKRRRSDKFILGSNRDDGGDDTTEESVNDDEDDDEDDGGGGGNSSVRMLPPNPSTSSSSMLNHHHHHHNNHNNNNHNNSNIQSSRKSFPPPAKVFRAAPSVTTTSTSTTWRAADEMIGVSVPRKARSASTKRSHDCWTSSGGGVSGGEQIHRQASSSPVRTSTATVLATPGPASPSSSNVSVRKKMKPNGPKLRPPKSSNKSSSSAQDDIEIEIAEVLYGMMRQGPSKQEIVGADSSTREINNNNNNNNIANKPTNDSKSSVSSPISNSLLPLSSSILPTNYSSSNAPVSATAPKRKRPRPIKYEEESTSLFTLRSSPISSTTKVEMDETAKTEIGSPHLDKNSGSATAENGSVSYDLVSSQASEPQLESVKPESNVLLPDSKGLTEELDIRGDMGVTKDGSQTPKKESTTGLRFDDDHRDNWTVTKGNSKISEEESQREEKFPIDLMAPPPLRSSPERDGEIDFVAVNLKTELKPLVKEDEKAVKIVREDAIVEAEEKKAKTVAEETESQKPVVKERNIDLQLDLEKSDRDSGSGSGSGSVTGNKLQQQHVQKQQPPAPVPEKTGQSNSLPLPLSMASWPGGLPPMGYMAPLQGVVSVDGSTVSSAAIQPPNFLFPQPRPKRCATHFYIARNIHYLQQISRMNPFWPAAAGSASLYGAKSCNLNVVPSAELHGNIPGRSVNSVQDKEQSLAIFPGPTGKDNKGSQPATIADAAQINKVLLQQALPPGAPSNMLHPPAFFFPLSQQQAAAAAAVRPVKSPPIAGNTVSCSASSSASVSATATAGPAGAAMGFNYPNMPPNMPGNETQYLAILPNNAYPFPISTHIGAPPAYRGTHAQAMPFFSGSFYSSQMPHPSQLQQQHAQQQPLPAQSQQGQQGHQNTSISSGSSSSQKHLQNQLPRPHSSGFSGGSGTLPGFPAPKNQPSQQLQLQQRQQQQNQQVSHQARQPENEMGEESPSADGRVSRANMSMYGQNFAVPLHPPNFALMTSASMGGPTSASGNHGEKKPQQQGSKAGVEPLTPQTFAMTFASVNGTATAPGLDISSITQNPTILHSFPEAMRHSYQMMAAAQAQQKKNFRVSEEGKSGDANVEEERKTMAGKPPVTVGQSIAFSRQDLIDTPVSTMGNTVIDSSTRTLNLGSASARTSVMPTSISNVNASALQQQLQRNQHHQQLQLQKQQQYAAAAAAAARSKPPATSNGSVYSDHLASSSLAAKFPNALSVFPQNVVQSNSSPAQSPQWKNSGRTNTSQVGSPSLASSTTSSVKNLSQQQGRTQPSHTQISFAANPKSSAMTQGQPPSSNNQSASPPMVVGSPTASSISKNSAGGSPRTTATTSAGNKSGQGSTLSSQQSKNSQSMPGRKSSPVPLILGNPNVSSSSTAGGKPQMSQQQQQQLSKHAMHQAQLLFSNAYIQAQAQHASSTTSSATAAGGFLIQRHRDQQQPGAATSSTGMLSLCPPVTHANSSTSDPAKAIADVANMKGSGLSTQGLIHTTEFASAQSSGKPQQLVHTGFPYVHVPTAVQVKPAEQKQPAAGE